MVVELACRRATQTLQGLSSSRNTRRSSSIDSLTTCFAGWPAPFMVAISLFRESSSKLILKTLAR